MADRQRPGLVILISGRGSNALALIDAARRGIVPAEVRGVIADGDAAGLARAADRGVDTACVPRRAFASRTAFEQALDEVIAGYAPDLIALAGFMRVLSAGFVERHQGRIVNIHPSLLPAHRGLDTHARALASRDAEHGASVHWVTPELDAGPVIAQARVDVRPDDDVDSLAARVLEQEHRLYPAAIALLLENEVRFPHDHSTETCPLVLDRDLDARGRRIGC